MATGSSSNQARGCVTSVIYHDCSHQATDYPGAIWRTIRNCSKIHFYVDTSNFPIVCAVLALDSWNYCSGEQAWQPDICKIAQSSLYSWTMYIVKQIRYCHLMLNCPATRWHLGFHFLLMRQTLRWRCWAVRPALQSDRSNCLVLTPHRQLGNYLLGTGESYSLTCATFDKSQCLTLTKRRQDGHQETPAVKAAEAAAPQTEPKDICALATQRTFLTQEEMALAQTGLCCLLLSKKEKPYAIHQVSS